MSKICGGKFKLHAAAVAVASCVCMASGMAQAAGMGKITVLSALGQPLKAEVEVNAGRDELTGMSVRLASQDAFRQAGIEYDWNLTDLRFALEKRPTGKSVVKVSTSKPVNEPFLDFLIELSWPTGRLVSEYTFLLDPPELAVKAASPAVSVVEAKSLAAAQVAPRAGEPTAKSAASEGKGVANESRQAKAAAKIDGDKLEGGSVHAVKAGDTLKKIAAENLYEGVSLEQMLVSLYRANPQAFVDGNINRLKAGAILNVPEKETVAAVSDAEAKAIYRTQGAEWSAYRRKLAAAAAQGPAKESDAGQAASGKVGARVEEVTPPAEAQKDKVKISRSEQGSGMAKGAEENLVVKDKTLKEAQERVAHLEKNVADLQKLLEMKNQSLAELQRQLAPASPGGKAPQLPSGGSPGEPQATPAPTVADAAKPVEAPKPPAPRKPVVLPQPEPEPSLIDELLSDPLPLVGGGGVLALIAGFVVYKRRSSLKLKLDDREEPGITGSSTRVRAGSAA